ncbi:DUF2087 domain-containing protein [Ciceribacter sp. L1K22]|uniref:DUF2087 domain-containing protein n=1 Tax=Ciceribacter sp. L1K22 TaxID=2820275 RepID=UPI001ABE3B1A|nr:DUF2087 domain-containing protein [Ciceribacter sp. L1K22]MBO3759256.1 DUF2087 domain-containing protein [Ciceribacter sp. L1K22]
MSRSIMTYHAPDISALARSLKRELDERTEKPGHVELLNILSRAAGFRNFQHLRAAQAAGERLAMPSPPAAPVDHVRVEAALRCFDGQGRLSRWPAKTSLQQLCLWALWARIPAEREFDEKAISGLLRDLHLFGDHALLRREMVNQRLLFRTQDCKVYRRIEQRPPAEAIALLKSLGGARARE